MARGLSGRNGTGAVTTIRILAVAALLAAAGAAPAADSSFTLPVPDGWRTETIPFPLEFAPSLPYSGVEELRFAPGVFVPASEEFWTYAFCWWLPEDTFLDSQLLEGDLATYFAGLTASVTESEHFAADDPRFAIDLVPERDGDHAHRWAGTAEIFDAFATHTQITLNLDVEAIPCPDAGAVALLFLASPQPAGHVVWRTLQSVRAGFSCLPAE